MKIVSWNVNSVRARLPLLLSWLEEISPDVVLLQETKVIDEQFPYEPIEDLGYNIAVCGQKSYNGVAILSKFPIEDIITSLPTYPENEQARYIEAVVMNGEKTVRVVSVYVPNGSEVGSEKFEYKLNFLDKLNEHLKDLLEYDEILAIGGDYNIAPEPIDVYDPKYFEGRICFHPEERKRFQQILDLGFTDSYRKIAPEIQQFSWWDYRTKGWENKRGLRIDHILLSKQAKDILKNAGVEDYLRGEKRPSDHAPVWIEV